MLISTVRRIAVSNGISGSSSGAEQRRRDAGEDIVAEAAQLWEPTSGAVFRVRTYFRLAEDIASSERAIPAEPPRVSREPAGVLFLAFASRESHDIPGRKMTQMLMQEPGWKLERKGSALLLRRDSSHPKSSTARVCFRCEVDVYEYERDEEYWTVEAETEPAASPLAMCASCLAALCVTMFLPWLLIGG
ncbi:uncharacterized protein LOC105189614 isoform X1 [Harpegnathos saltator]|nr:uncharacterized protein LOC105189614 isoform X1 [Harpegnathos saltator]